MAGKRQCDWRIAACVLLAGGMMVGAIRVSSAEDRGESSGTRRRAKSGPGAITVSNPFVAPINNPFRNHGPVAAHSPTPHTPTTSKSSLPTPTRQATSPRSSVVQFTPQPVTVVNPYTTAPDARPFTSPDRSSEEPARSPQAANPFSSAQPTAGQSLRWGPLSQTSPVSSSSGRRSLKAVGEPPDLIPTPRFRDADATDLANLLVGQVNLVSIETDADDPSADGWPDRSQSPSAWSSADWLTDLPEADAEEFELTQPPGLLPEDRPVTMSLTPEAIHRLPRDSGEPQTLPSPASPPNSIPSNAARADPFDEPPGLPVVVSDESIRPTELLEPAHIAEAMDEARAVAPQLVDGPESLPVPPPVAPPVGPSGPPLAELLAAARRDAQAAQTINELADVIRTCRTVIGTREETGEAASEATVQVSQQARQLAGWAHNRRGEMAAAATNEAAALREFQIALQYDADCWLALHNRAVSFARRGQRQPALRDFSRVIELNPGLAVAYRNRGELLAAWGRTREAVEDFSEAITQQPDDADLYTLRAQAYHRLRQFRRAMDDYNAALRIGQRLGDAYTGRGNLFAEIGRYREAVRDFQQAVSEDPTHDQAYRSLGWLMATCPDPRYRDPGRALVAARRAAELASPGDPSVLDTLAAASAASGNFEDAIQFARQAIRVAPVDQRPEILQRLARYQQRRTLPGEPTRRTASANRAGQSSGVQPAAHTAQPSRSTRSRSRR